AEMRFHAVCCTGAYSVFRRRLGMKRAEDMIFSGRIYTAEELHEMGLVDLLVEDGTGETAVREYIHRNERHRNGMQAVFSCRQHFQPVTYEEMLNITNVWVDAAMRLEEKDLRLMSRLARSQFRRVHGGAAAPVQEGAVILEE